VTQVTTYPAFHPQAVLKLTAVLETKFLLTAEVIKGGSEENASVVTEILLQFFADFYWRFLVSNNHQMFICKRTSDRVN